MAPRRAFPNRLESVVAYGIRMNARIDRDGPRVRVVIDKGGSGFPETALDRGAGGGVNGVLDMMEIGSGDEGRNPLGAETE